MALEGYSVGDGCRFSSEPRGQGEAGRPVRVRCPGRATGRVGEEQGLDFPSGFGLRFPSWGESSSWAS